MKVSSWLAAPIIAALLVAATSATVLVPSGDASAKGRGRHPLSQYDFDVSHIVGVYCDKDSSQTLRQQLRNLLALEASAHPDWWADLNYGVRLDAEHVIQLNQCPDTRN